MSPRTGALICVAIAIFYLLRHPRFSHGTSAWVRYVGIYFHSLAWLVVALGVFHGSRITLICAIPIYVLYLLAWRRRDNPSAP